MKLSCATDVLPDFSNISDCGELEQRFYRAAAQIILEHELVRENYRWQIAALELYAFIPHLWEDPTTHRRPEQLNLGSWYIHYDGAPAAKRLGIDITAGCKDKDIYVGLLVAGIGSRDGSGRALKSIIRGSFQNGEWKYAAAEKGLMRTKIHCQEVFAGESHLRLEPCSKRSGDLYYGPRRLPAKVDEPYRSKRLRVGIRRSVPGMCQLTL